MADFNSNFNDIQKQIAVADLTAEQIQALVSALQNRRSTRPRKPRTKAQKTKRRFDVFEDAPQTLFYYGVFGYGARAFRNAYCRYDFGNFG